MKMEIEVIPVTGTHRTQQIRRSDAIRTIQNIIEAPIACDSVNLRDGRVMIVDDTGINDRRPINPRATEMYQSIYPLARQNGATIHGDVVIAWDKDFA